MKILLTGATGFVGVRLLDDLLCRGHEVIAVAREVGPRTASGLTWLQADIREPFELTGKLDAVIHAASLIGTRETSLAELRASNVEGTRNVLNAALQAEASKLIYFSSLSVYGAIEAELVDENTPLRNAGAYGLTKAEGEVLLRECADRLTTVSLRLPGITPKLKSGPWLAKMMLRARAGEPIEIFNPESPFNNAVERDDLAQFVCSLLDQDWTGHPAITMGASKPLPLRELIEFLIAETNSTSEIIVRETPNRSFLISNEKAMREFAYNPSAMRDIARRLASVELRTASM